MRRLLPILFALLAFAAPAAAQFSLPTLGPMQPPNLGDLKTVLVRYHDSGQWAAEQARVARDAERWLVARVAMGKSQKLAAVFDIDETSLANYPAMKRDDFGFILDGPCTPGGKDACGMRAWIAQGRDAAIPGTLALYKRARSLGVAVFFITGRNETLRPGTVKNLRAVGTRAGRRCSWSRAARTINPPPTSRRRTARRSKSKATRSSSTSATSRATSPAATPRRRCCCRTRITAFLESAAPPRFPLVPAKRPGQGASGGAAPLTRPLRGHPDQVEDQVRGRPFSLGRE